MLQLIGSKLIKRETTIQTSRKLYSTVAPPNPTGIQPSKVPGSNQFTKAQDIIRAYKRPNAYTGYFGSYDYMHGKIDTYSVFNDISQYTKDMPLIKDDGTPGIANSIEESKQRVQELGDHTLHIIELANELENADSERQIKIIDSLQLLAVQYAWIWQQIAMQPLRLNQTPDGKLHGLGNPFIPRQIARPSLMLSHLFRTSAQQSYARYSGPNMFKFAENTQPRPDNVESHCYIEGNPRDSEGNLIYKEMNYFGERISFPDNAEKQFQVNHGLQEWYTPNLIAATEIIKKALISGNDDLLIHGYKKATEAVKPLADIMQQMFHMSDSKKYKFVRAWLISPNGRTRHFPNGITLEGAKDFGLSEEGHADVGETGAQASKQLLVKELGLLYTTEDHDLHVHRTQFFATQEDASKVYAMEFRNIAKQYRLDERINKNQQLALAFLEFIVQGAVRHQDIHSTTALHYIYKAGDLTFNSGSTAADYLYSSVFKTATTALERANRIKFDELSSDGVVQVEKQIKYINGIINKAISRKAWIVEQLHKISYMYK